MSIKLLTEHHLEFLSLKGGCTGSSESTLVTLLEISCHGSYVNCLPADDSHEMSSLFSMRSKKDSQKLSSAAVVIGTYWLVLYSLDRTVKPV